MKIQDIKTGKLFMIKNYWGGHEAGSIFLWVNLNFLNEQVPSPISHKIHTSRVLIKINPDPNHEDASEPYILWSYQDSFMKVLNSIEAYLTYDDEIEILS